MEPTRNERIEELFAAAHELPEAEREAWLERQVADGALRAEVRALLAAGAEPASLLDRQAVRKRWPGISAPGVKRLRTELITLIESIEVHAARQAKDGEGFDVSYLRAELGLPGADQRTSSG